MGLKLNLKGGFRSLRQNKLHLTKNMRLRLRLHPNAFGTSHILGTLCAKLGLGEVVDYSFSTNDTRNEGYRGSPISNA